MKSFLVKISNFYTYLFMSRSNVADMTVNGALGCFCIRFPICICICFCICICRQYTFIQSSKVADTIGERDAPGQVAQTKVASPELLWLTIFLSIFVLVSVSVLVFYQYLHISVFESAVSGHLVQAQVASTCGQLKTGNICGFATQIFANCTKANI